MVQVAFKRLGEDPGEGTSVIAQFLLPTGPETGWSKASLRLPWVTCMLLTGTAEWDEGPKPMNPTPLLRQHR
jgi:hypothetical protein